MNTRKLIILAVLALTASLAVAQGPAPPAQGVQDLMNDTSGQAEIRVDQRTGLAKFVRMPVQSAAPFAFGAPPASGKLGRPGSKTPADVQAMNFFRAYGSAFGVAQADSELAAVRTVRDGYGNEHAILKQTYKGLPVFGGELRAHFNTQGQLYAANGNFVPVSKLDLSPSLSPEEAAARAIRTVMLMQFKREQAELEVGDEKISPDETFEDLTAFATTLMVFRSGLLQGVSGSDHLAYEVEVRNEAVSIREFVYVDAHSGKAIDQITGIHDAKFRRAYDAEGFTAPGPNYPATPFWVEGDPFPTFTLEADNMIFGSDETYDLFDNAFGRDSFDGVGATMDSIFNRGNGCPNASWNGTFISFCPGTTSDDVVGHEWGHAYTEYTNDLIYQWQPGALNESYSDIWGEIVDLINGRQTDAPGGARSDGGCSIFTGGAPDVSYRWLMGEDATAFGTAIRDMWNPNCAGDPGSVTDPVYWCSTGDNGGVHINSGIPNHAFALMVDGGTYNGYSASGIGLIKAAHIHWAAQNLLTNSSNFVDHADALDVACSSLIGVDLNDLSTGAPSGEMIAGADCAEVAAISAAVEFRTSPTQCNFETLLDPDAPALCEGQGSVIPIASQDFEGGSLPPGWSVGSHDVVSPGTFDNPGWSVETGLPAGNGSDYAAFVPDLNVGDCVTDIEAGALYLDTPPLPLPPGVAPHVAFDHWVATEAGWDGGNLKISVNGGPFEVVPSSAISFNAYNDTLIVSDNPLGGEEAFTGADEGSVAGSWGQTQVNLYGLAFPGDTVVGRFDFGVDGCAGTFGWYVDNLQLYACSDEPLPICGDGQLNHPDEVCDDGNMDDGDGCSSDCEVEDGWLCSDPMPSNPDGSNVVADESFEGGDPNADWATSSTLYVPGVVPLCGPGCPVAGLARTGSWLVWIGGVGTGVTAFVEQDITIPSAATDLTLYAWRGICDVPADTLHVSLDGTDIGTIACTATDADWVPYTFPVAPFNDDGAHTLSIGGAVGGINSHTNFFVEDVVLNDNTPTEATPSVCVPLVDDLACSPGIVGFNDGIPPSWTVFDNEGTGVVWTDIASSLIGGNFTGGTGDAASVNSDAFIFTEYDTELISNSFSLDGATSASLDYLVNYQNIGSDLLDVDVSTDGGSTWANLLSWNEDHPPGGLFAAPGEAVSLDLAPYLGESDVQVRWHYYNENFGDWDWYAQVDDVSLACECEDAEPIGWWRFDEDSDQDGASGSIVLDSTANGNDGHLWNGASRVPGPFGPTSVLLDGINDHVNVGSNAILDNLQAFTYSAWINPAATGNREIFSKNNSARELRLMGGGNLRGCIIATGGNACSNSVETVPLGTWTHVAMTYDHAGDKLVHLYIDGAEVGYAAQSTGGGGSMRNDAKWKQILGRRQNNSRPFAGMLDEMMIFDQALGDCNLLNLAAGAPSEPSEPSGSCGDCLEDNGTPGCENSECEAAVCAVDSFCCGSIWDSLCAQEAADICVPDICTAEPV